MIELATCTRCEGFLPAGAGRCPHCGVSARRIARKILNVCGGGAIAMTLMACYGGPPERKSECDAPGSAEDAMEYDEALPDEDRTPCAGDPAVRRGG